MCLKNAATVKNQVKNGRHYSVKNYPPAYIAKINPNSNHLTKQGRIVVHKF